MNKAGISLFQLVPLQVDALLVHVPPGSLFFGRRSFLAATDSGLQDLLNLAARSEPATWQSLFKGTEDVIIAAQIRAVTAMMKTVILQLLHCLHC